MIFPNLSKFKNWKIKYTNRKESFQSDSREKILERNREFERFAGNLNVEQAKSRRRISITTLSIPSPSVDDIDALSRIIRRYIIRQLIPPRNYKSSSTPRDNKLDEIIRAYKVSWKKWASTVLLDWCQPRLLVSGLVPF